MTLLIKTIDNSNKKRQEIKQKQREVTQSDVLLEFVHIDEEEFDRGNDFDEVNSYAKAKLSMSKDESVVESGH